MTVADTAPWSSGSSRCWVPRKNSDGSVRDWRVRALAYTINGKSVNPVASMNWCPGFFDLWSCNDAVSTNSRSEFRKWDMTEYSCRGEPGLKTFSHAPVKFVPSDRRDRACNGARVVPCRFDLGGSRSRRQRPHQGQEDQDRRGRDFADCPGIWPALH